MQTKMTINEMKKIVLHYPVYYLSFPVKNPTKPRNVALWQKDFATMPRSLA